MSIFRMYTAKTAYLKSDKKRISTIHLVLIVIATLVGTLHCEGMGWSRKQLYYKKLHSFWFCFHDNQNNYVAHVNLCLCENCLLYKCGEHQRCMPWGMNIVVEACFFMLTIESYKSINWWNWYKVTMTLLKQLLSKITLKMAPTLTGQTKAKKCWNDECCRVTTTTVR